MTMGMIAISCILMKTLLCSYGLSMMDELGQYALGFSTECGQACTMERRSASVRSFPPSLRR